jgi:DNA replication and repair protein RecF|tara:strand:- start:2107 stop:3147 length:1041 start_codon:yes stop_codon:yes gene_type:complete
MKLSFDSAITIICGENNAGKTSLLEAIYLTSNLKSFKGVPNAELIRSSSNIFKISLNFMQNSLKNNIFVEKTLKSSKILYNDEKSTKSDISLLFPCYSLVFGFNNILLNDSSYRRDFIDTGMFHVEPESRKSFNVFEKVLKQRNFLLKSKKYDSIDLWDRQLIDANNKLSEYRESYFKCLKNHFSTIIESIKNKIPEIYNDISSLELEYINGWGSDCFDMVLKQNQSKDRSLGYTSRGTHRSDFIVTSLGKPVRESGSMSTLVLSCLIINLAKINVFHVKHGFKPVLLIDDLFFGIDDKNLRTVVKLLVHSRGNIVLTAPNIYKKILEKVCEENQELKLIAVGENS